ncbi:MAG: YdcF family protein [Anaerolineae bacterium]|nr:YdcF family protein [Anaerolineae bacterium]
MPKWYERTGSNNVRATRRARWPGCLVLLLLAVLVVILGPLWLPWIARVLVVDQPPVAADAMMVLGGGDGSVQDRAIQLYNEGWAPLIISSGEPPNLPGPERSYAELGADYMIERGVPRESILVVPQATSTYEEAVVCLALCQERGVERLLVIADPYHTRRTSLTFGHVFRDAPITLTFVGARPDWFDPSDWWKSERPVLAVFQEYLKLGYYLVKGYII